MPTHAKKKIKSSAATGGASKAVSGARDLKKNQSKGMERKKELDMEISERVADVEQLDREVQREKTEFFLATVWINLDLVTTEWSDSETSNRLLDKQKVNKMINAWTENSGRGFSRLKAAHAIICTIDESNADMFRSTVEVPQKDPAVDAMRQASLSSADILRSASLSLLNPNGTIFDLREDGLWRVRLAKLMQCEAGQHRLSAVQHVTTIDHNGMWPAQVFVRKFSPGVLGAIRKNITEFTFEDSNDDVIYQLAPLFRLQYNQTSDKALPNLTAAEQQVYEDKCAQIKGKVKTSLNKSWGAKVKALVGEYPQIASGWTENRAAILNRSIHNDIIGSSLDKLLVNLNVLFPCQEARFSITQQDFTILTKVGSSYDSWASAVPGEMTRQIFTTGFQDYKIRAKATLDSFEKSIVKILENTNMRSHMGKLSIPQSFVGYIDLYTDLLERSAYICKEVAYWIAPWGSSEGNAVQMAQENCQWETFNLRLTKAAKHVPGEITELSWSRFVAKRRYLVHMDDQFPTPLVGNRSFNKLYPEVSQVTAMCLKRDRDKSPSQVRIAEVAGGVAANKILNFIVEHQESLMAEWGPAGNMPSGNGVADCSAGKFPVQLDTDSKKGLQKALETYRKRFTHSHWSKLYNTVLAMLPILWYVVSPSAIGKVPRTQSSHSDVEPFLHPNITGYLRKLTGIELFKHVTKVSWKAKQKDMFASELAQFIPEVIEIVKNSKEGLSEGDSEADGGIDSECSSERDREVDGDGDRDSEGASEGVGQSDQENGDEIDGVGREFSDEVPIRPVHDQHDDDEFREEAEFEETASARKRQRLQ